MSPPEKKESFVLCSKLSEFFFKYTGLPMKTAIVTGGNSGIGYATAKLMKDKGYEVLITGRNEERVSKVAKELDIDYAIVDMSDVTGLEKLASRYKDTGLDALVLNAAMATFKPIESIDMSEFDTFINTNIKGPYFFIKALVNSLIKKQGAITVITSAVVDKGVPNGSLYTLTKGAMDAFVRSFAAEMAPHRVRVNCVSPGAVNTEIFGKLGVPEELIKKRRTMLESRIPLGRYGEPNELAHTIIAQLEATYVTGANWRVDGGESMT